MNTATPTSPISIKNWTPQQKKDVLAALARELLGKTSNCCVEVQDEKNRPVAYLLPAFDTSKEFGCDFTPEFFLELLRRAATPENSITWQEMQDLLDEDDAAEQKGL